jgi:hypothetical protein
VCKIRAETLAVGGTQKEEVGFECGINFTASKRRNLSLWGAGFGVMWDQTGGGCQKYERTVRCPLKESLAGIPF